MVVPPPADLPAFERIAIDAAASRPMRVSVQLVRNQNGHWSRWQRSIYLDQTRRTVSIAFADMRPGPPEVEGTVPLAAIDALVILIDTNNTQPGTSGEVAFNRIAYQR
jgi:hypothetical protein